MFHSTLHHQESDGLPRQAGIATAWSGLDGPATAIGALVGKSDSKAKKYNSVSSLH